MDADSGRIYWEQAPDQLGALGSRNLAAATPYLVPGQNVLNGLWLESSQLHHDLVAIDSAVARAARSEPAAADQQLTRVLAQLHALGATRFVALTAPTAQLLARNGLRIVHTTPQLALFRLIDAPLIEVIDQSERAVQIIEWADQRVRFRTDAVGQPHLVRMSYFPNWKAHGARPPERTEHSMMLVTPEQHEVELVFAPTWVEMAGAITSALTALTLIAFAVVLRRRASSGGD
jgi:hypothetical protein